jgi:hypothetical protein
MMCDAKDGSVQPGGENEILAACLQQSAADDPRQTCPSDQRQDDGDHEISGGRSPLGRHRSSQSEPERQCRDRDDQFDHPLDDGVGPTAEVARHAADEKSQDK